MSFAEQERALLELLFDEHLRDQFCTSPAFDFPGFDLDSDELDQLSNIRRDALRVDAEMRTSMVLSELCISYPLTFAITSAAAGGMQVLGSLIGADLMRGNPVQRAARFGESLGRVLNAGFLAVPVEPQRAVAVLDAERGMALTSAALRVALMRGDEPQPSTALDAAGWQAAPVRVADWVSANVVPVPLGDLRQDLCKVPDRNLYRHLVAEPLSDAEVASALTSGEPRVFVARAIAEVASHTDPVVSHVTVELGEGFAHLLGNLDGSITVDYILEQLTQAGAEQDVCAEVHRGFDELRVQGILVAAR